MKRHLPKHCYRKGRKGLIYFERGDVLVRMPDDPASVEFARVYAQLRAGRQLNAPGRVILEIPAAPDDAGVLTGVRQATSIDGALIRIGGAGDNASLQMQDLQGRIMSGFTVNRHLAKEMAKLIYEPIRVSGIGIWNRTSEGVWELDKMQVQSYETLDDEPLDFVIERLRDLKVQWPSDAVEKLIAEREAGL